MTASSQPPFLDPSPVHPHQAGIGLLRSALDRIATFLSRVRRRLPGSGVRAVVCKAVLLCASVRGRFASPFDHGATAPLFVANTNTEAMSRCATSIRKRSNPRDA